MERDQHQPKQANDDNNKQPRPSPNNNNNNNNNCTTNERLKRDEWSEGAVSSLLEAYKAKWSLRNRAKLKGQDWDDVAKHVSSRANNSKFPKTLTQCKNKIESMKKRYRSESAASDTSSWPLYSRLDLLLRGNGSSPMMQVVANPPPALDMEAPPPPGSVARNSRGSKGYCGNNISGLKSPDQKFDKNEINDTKSSNTNAIYIDKENSNVKPPLKTNKVILKRQRNEECKWEIGKSIQRLAEVVVRSEQARMETMREIERIRVEAEEKRGEFDLKRIEIIANTQLEIARLFVKGSIVDSSLRVGRS